MVITYELKQVIPKKYPVDFNVLHELIYKSVIKTFPLSERMTWDPFSWMANIGDEFADFAGYYLDALLNDSIDEQVNDLEIDDICNDFNHFLEKLYLGDSSNKQL